MEVLAIRFAVAFVMASVMMVRTAVRRNSVDRSAVLVGIPVMVIHMIAGYRFAALLLVFFFTSSKLTKVGEEEKRNIDAEFKQGGQRNWSQVLANSGIATILVTMIATVAGSHDKCLDTKESKLVTGLLGGIIGHYACCNGDTWSSEVGMLSKGQPRLITTFKTVRKGTNGAVSLEGLLAATAAGFSIGLTFLVIGFFTTESAADAVWRQLLVLPVASMAGLCGSLIDSLLGATLQFSGFCSVRNKAVGKPGPTVTRISGVNVLGNNGVNCLSILATTLLASLVCLHIF